MTLLNLILEFIHQLTKLGGLIWLLEQFKGSTCFFKNRKGFIHKTASYEQVTKK